MDRIEPDKDSAAELKRKLGKRLGLAAVLIVVLLGALAMFDRLSTMDRDDTANRDVAPVQPRLGPSISSGRPPEAAMPAEEPITPSPTLAPKQTPLAVEPPPKPEIPALPTVAPTAPTAPFTKAPVVTETKPLPPIAPPPVAKAPVIASGAPTPPTPVPPLKPMATGPMPAAPSTTKPIAPVAPVSPPAPIVAPKAPPAATVPEGSSSSPMLGSAAPATSTAPAAAARLPSPVSPPAQARPALSRLMDGFVLQAGVFTSTERAEELKARLVMAGVPVTIETRVQVGPFKTQKEADAARQKIRELGIDSILIPPRSSRR